MLYPFETQFEMKVAKMWARMKEKVEKLFLFPNSLSYHVNFVII